MRNGGITKRIGGVQNISSYQSEKREKEDGTQSEARENKKEDGKRRDKRAAVRRDSTRGKLVKLW